MKLPKSLKIGSMTYTVKPMSQEHHEMSEAVGMCDKTHNVIYIYMDQSPPKLWSTLYHEVFHAMMEEGVIPVAHQDEETLVSHLERIGCLFVLDNPTFYTNLHKVLNGGG